MAVWRPGIPAGADLFLRPLTDSLPPPFAPALQRCVKRASHKKGRQHDQRPPDFHPERPDPETFRDRATACAQAALDLQDLVQRLGGEPASHSTLGGTLHRQWVNLKSAITGRDDESILDECERGEDAAVNAYRKALSEELPTDIRLVIERQYQGVLANHDKVRSLRNEVRARKAA